MPTIRLTILSVIVAIAALVLVVELLRRRRLREKYAVIWVVISLGTLVVALFPPILGWVAELVGIRTPSNLLFFSSLVILFAVSLQLSREVGLLEEQSRRLAEEVGSLRLRVDALEEGRIRVGSVGENGSLVVLKGNGVAAPVTVPDSD